MAVLTVIHNTTEQTINAQIGGTVLAALQAAGITAPEAPCGGNGTCKKCLVLVDGQEVLACRTAVTGNCTVVAHLYDLKTGVLLGTQSGVNIQRTFGADVISRIQYANESKDGLERIAPWGTLPARAPRQYFCRRMPVIFWMPCPSTAGTSSFPATRDLMTTISST